MSENLSKLGIDPRIVLVELDRTKTSYLEKRRSKSKTPRNSQTHKTKTPRNSKTHEESVILDTVNDNILE